MQGCHLVLDQRTGNMLACKDHKKQFASVKKTKVGFHVVNFNEKKKRKKFCRLCFKNVFVEREGSFLHFPTCCHLSTLCQSKKNFVRNVNGK